MKMVTFPPRFMKSNFMLVAGMLSVLAGTCFGQDTAVHRAAEAGNLNQLKTLLKANISLIDAKDQQGRTPLLRAALSERRNVVDYLLIKGATIDISAASILGLRERVAFLLKNEPGLVNVADAAGKTPLHWAALSGNKDVAQLLVDRGAKVNVPDRDGFTALHWTVMFDHPEVARVLLARAADVNAKVPKFEWTPLRLAVLYDRRELAALLLARGADVNARENFGFFPLHEAVIHEHKEMVEILLRGGASVNAKDENGDTPLLLAHEKNFSAIADLLVKHGAKE